jgi:hypothetical protein
MSLSTKLSRKLPKKLSTKLSALLAASLLIAATSSAHAATATTTININLPQVVILYTFDTINLTIDAAAVGSLLTGAAQCTDANNLCIEIAPTPALTITDLSAASVDADIASSAAAIVGSRTVTIKNAFGVRSLGVAAANYTATIAETAAAAFSNEVITAPANTGLALSRGDISFTLDLNQTSGTSASVTYTITVNGV